MPEPGRPIYRPDRSTGVPLATTLLLAAIVGVFVVIFVVSR